MSTVSPGCTARPTGTALPPMAASMRLPLFTAIFMSFKKMLNSGQRNNSYFPMNRKYSGMTLYIWMMSR